MISVVISINGNPVTGRSATNMGVLKNGKTKYLCDDGMFITHDSDDGAVKLAIKILENIREVK